MTIDTRRVREVTYTIEGGPEPIDDSIPERLRERREALGLSVTQAATAVTALGYGEWDETSIHYCESPRALLTVRQLDLDRYAAALSAEEARRAKMAAERDAHAVPRLDWLEPASPPAHEVVDVPPEPWHARLVRLAQVAQDTSKACAEAEDAFKVADAERERTRLVRAAAREACHAARKALTAATTARAIIDAQQPASVQAAYDAFRTIATPDTILALITRLRAAEARTAWADSLALQAYSMAAAIEQADEDGGLDSLGPVTAAIIRQDVARILEIVNDRQDAPRGWRPDPMSPEHAALWDAINQYVVTCHGDPAKHVYGNTPRMKAVCAVEDALRAVATAGWQPLPAAPEAP